MARTQLDAIKQLKGSGTDATKFLKSNGAGQFVMGALTSGPYNRAVSFTPVIDGTTKVFTLASAVATDSEQVYVNGELLTPSNDYTISGTTLTLVAAMFAPSAVDLDVLRVYGVY